MSTFPLATTTFGTLLEAVAAKTPAPGGGATACAAAALACAQAHMVVAYSAGKKDLAPHAALHDEARTVLTNARTALLQLGDEDASAYQRLNMLQRLPEGDPQRAALPGAARACVQIPLAALAACAQVANTCRSLAGKSNPHLASDLAISLDLIQSAARCCAVNVRINLPALPGDAERADAEQTAAALLASVSGG